MDLIVIMGAGAVGKMTVGQELMKITDYRLFHNHMTIEPIREIFGKIDFSLVSEMREMIFNRFIESDNVGMIFTYMFAFDQPSEWEYMKYLSDKFEASGGTVYYVELVADREVRIERNKTENRLQNKASKRNVAISEERMLREDTKYRLVSLDGEVPFEHYLKLDNTHLTPAEAAKHIKDFFGLPDKSAAETVARAYLEPVDDSELPTLLKMQIESFMPLYEKYQDEGSPAIETLERIQTRAAQPSRQYYFINSEGARVGAINIGTRGETGVYYISPIFILPKFRGQGFAYAAIQKAFEMYSDATCWKLDTILQEEGNCRLYEKCGFVRVGEEHPVNDRMTLVDYEMKVSK